MKFPHIVGAVVSLGLGWGATPGFAQPSPATAPVTANPVAAASSSATAPSTPDTTAATSDKSASSAGSDNTTFTLENSLSLRDPFRRPTSKMANGEEGGTIPELERYELDKFKLVGVITGPKKNKALITTPDGKMHIVAEAMHIGTRRGSVKKIAPGLISVEEKVVNLLGQEESVETTIEFESANKDKGGSL